MKTKKLILFGGTFDPVHTGHITVSRYGMDHIGADKLIMIPAKRSPLKQAQPIASDDDRTKMISLAIQNEEDFELSDFEIKGPCPSYTINTVKHFIEINPTGTEVYWLVGADSISDLRHWYRIEELMNICSLCIMSRGGFAEPELIGLQKIFGDARIAQLKSNIIHTPLVDISSSEIRRRIACDDDVSEMVAPSVGDYIKAKGLYR